MLESGTRLGRYEIRAKIGEGGMGEVYLAEDTQLHRKVALKVLTPAVTQNRERLGRFEQEAFTASALNHPNILTVFEVGEADSVRFIATEYVDGETLGLLMTQSRIRAAEAIDIAAQVASALSAAHKAGVVHRDIKPENIMVRREDSIVKVLDFGLAKITHRPATQSPGGDLEAATQALVNTSPGVVMGTTHYMSPEQARGLPLDERTDIWSLSVVIYEMVAGRPPFTGQTTSDVIAMILQKEPPALTLLSDEATPRLDEIVTKALAKDREERYQTAKDLLIDLRRLKQHLDFENEKERTFSPESKSISDSAQSSDRMSVRSATPTMVGLTALSAQPSSAEYIVSEIKRHKKSLSVIAVVVLLFMLGLAAYSLYVRRAPALTDKDTVLIADFENTTGDPVFDGTLKDALAVQLEQSPFLRIFPDEQIRQTLRFMNRAPGERLTTAVAREICERQSIKAYFTGSIASLGRNYVIKLEAINARTGETLAREQIETEGKEQVLKSVGAAATNLRQKLGESLASIQKFDTPVAQATTSSLEALKSFSLGNEERRKNHTLEAIPFYKRAIELDHDFALAYAALGDALRASAQYDEAADAATKAFERRERVSEREKYIITLNYYGNATGNVQSEIEAASLWAKAYPRDAEPHMSLASRYYQAGEFSKGVSEGDEAIRLAPNLVGAYTAKVWPLISLNRFDQAKEVLQLALAKGLDSRILRNGLFLIALEQGDNATMQQQIDWARGRSDEQYVTSLESTAALQRGQLRLARQLMDRAVERAQRSNLNEVPADFASLYVEHDAFIGTCRYVRDDVATMLALSHSARNLSRSAMSLALCGELAKAESLSEELVKQHPKDTLSVVIQLPATRAAIEIRRGHPDKAIQLLQTAGAYANASFYWHPYLLGMAYLNEKKSAEAAAEFQKVIDNPGQSLATSLYPLSYLGLARAAVLVGDTGKARKAYEDFFAQWKDADADIPILIEAKREYGKLK
jgi:eukaryotic-like serine/threonine-protein kinase